MSTVSSDISSASQPRTEKQSHEQENSAVTNSDEENEEIEDQEIEMEALQVTKDATNISSSQISTIRAYDGRDIEVKSMAVQTEPETGEELLSRAATAAAMSVSETIEEPSKEPETKAASLKQKSRSASATESVEMTKNYSSGEESVAASSSHRKSASMKSSSQRSAHSSRHRTGTGTTSGRTTAKIPPYPRPYIDDEFGIPLNLSSDEEEHVQFQEYPDEQQPPPAGRLSRQVRAVEEGIMPSVGPPQILQYSRETEADRQPLQPESLESRLEAVSLIPGGKCSFCGRVITELPNLEQQSHTAPQEIYCCQEYRSLLETALAHQHQLLNQKAEAEKKVFLSLKPHAPFQNKNKENNLPAEKEKEKQDRENNKKKQKDEASLKAAAPTLVQSAANFQQVKAREVEIAHAAVTHRMKTINYQLSSLRCLEEGWTLRPPSPMAAATDQQLHIYEVELDRVTSLADALTAREPADSEVMLKYYPNGAKFFTVFRDGSGNIFYPSGNTAVVMTTEKPGQITYVLFDDVSHADSPVLAVFDTTGHGSCYYPDGALRLCYDPVEGIELDKYGARRRHWLWSGAGAHSHAPPFQPLCCGLNRTLGLRITSREQIAVNLTAQCRSAKLQVGSKLRRRNSGLHPIPLANPDQMRLEELRLRVTDLLQRTDHLAQHPKHPHPERLPTSLHLENRRLRLERSRQPTMIQ